MNYDESVQYIELLSPTLTRPGLERFHAFMEEIGNKQNNYPSIHVAGTNGKGSVVTMIAETLNMAGFKTGKYTGPHLISINERFEIAGKLLSNDEFAYYCSEIRSLSESFAQRHPEHAGLTWFEVLTAIAFFSFAKNDVEAQVFEVGLGGQYDATNVLARPVCTSIVNVSLDHTHLLGSTVSEIAFEKAGILKPEVPLITGCQTEALRAVLEEARKKEVPVICVREDGSLKAGFGSSKELYYLEQLQNLYEDCKLSLNKTIAKQKGYQRLNAAVAAATLGVWEIETGKRCLDKLDSALSSYFWPGRLQYLRNKEVLLDGAHNEAGAKALESSLSEIFPLRKRTFVLSFYKSKHFEDFMKVLIKPGDSVFAAQATGRRPVVPANEIRRLALELGAAEAYSFNTLDEAFEAALARMNTSNQICVGTGSFATVKAGLEILGYNSCQASRQDSLQLSRETQNKEEAPNSPTLQA